jgi:hypothetical protein
MLNLTPEQALLTYHACYDNTAYRTATDEIVWILGAGNDLSDAALRQTPDYLALSNMLINVALEICGHPHYHGAGWQLATSLNAVIAPRLKAGELDQAAIERLWQLIDGYFGIYRHHQQQCYARLSADVQAKASLQLESAWLLTAEAVRSASDLPDWKGRAVYHLSASAAGLLQTTLLLLRRESAAYLNEKFSRAIRDLGAALAEFAPYSPRLPFLARLRTALDQAEED